MNYKALALGALAGFVFALSPACGNGDEGGECGPENCSTCCGADGQCVTTVDATACGASGNQCVGCGAGQICQGGACVATATDTGGNNGDPVCENGAPCPNGCCSKIGCLPGNTATNCGSGGAACQECTGGTQCLADSSGVRSCRAPPTGLGAECTTDADCSALGTGARCALTADVGGFDYERGFCTIPCMGTSCPSVGSTPGVCVSSSLSFDGGTNSVVGLNDNSCFMRCNYNIAVTGCPDDLYCLPWEANGVGACVPYTPAPAGVIGTACTPGTLDCTFPPSSGFCYPETSGSDQTGFTDGYCFADCAGSDTACTEGSVCLLVSQSQNLTWCTDLCPTPGERSDCRDGYTCYGLNQGTEGICFPSCDAPGWGCDMGETCNVTTGFCETAPDAGM